MTKYHVCVYPQAGWPEVWETFDNRDDANSFAETQALTAGWGTDVILFDENWKELDRY